MMSFNVRLFVVLECLDNLETTKLAFFAALICSLCVRTYIHTHARTHIQIHTYTHTRTYRTYLYAGIVELFALPWLRLLVQLNLH